MLHTLSNPFNHVSNNSKSTRKYRLYVCQSTLSTMCQCKYKINNSWNLKYIVNRFLNIIIKKYIVIFKNQCKLKKWTVRYAVCWIKKKKKKRKKEEKQHRDVTSCCCSVTSWESKTIGFLLCTCVRVCVREIPRRSQIHRLIMILRSSRDKGRQSSRDVACKR